MKACRDLPGHELFQYVDADGRRQSIGSSDVNEYLREITGQPFTSKDFRTWGGTVLAASALAQTTDRDASSRSTKKQIVNAVKAAVSERLGNTVDVCRRAFREGQCVERRREVGRRSPPATAREGVVSSSAENAPAVPRRAEFHID